MLAILATVTAILSAQDTLSPAARRILQDVRYLASDSLAGRQTGSFPMTRAGGYIAGHFRGAGLRPGGDDGGYFQRFTVAADAPAVAHAGLGALQTFNVVGVIPGSSWGRGGQVVVVGAHYDHLGTGQFGALDSAGQVHNGADDNASGTAALLEIARILSRRRPTRTVVLVAFSAEELGNLGSAYFVGHPVPQPVDSIYAMVNLDMVGRLRNGRLLAFGVETAREFRGILDSLNTTARFDLAASGDGWGPSDHSSFYAARRPVLHLFTDLHEDYHRATDDWDKIDAAGIARVARFAADLAWTLANRREPLTFVDVPRPQPVAGAAGARPYLGTIPDMSGSPGGVRLSGVRTGSPAEQAGLRAGDILTGLGDKVIADLNDMEMALRAHKAGDTVTVVFKRDGVEHRSRTVLGRRGGGP
jgi:peptidase M28-like protein/PDZ domain-containing protein